MPKPKGKRKKNCDGCKKLYSTKGLKKKNGNVYCHKCYLKRSKCVIPKVPKKIPKSYMPHGRKRVVKKKEVVFPKIRGAKKRVILTKNVHLFLTKEEKSILYQKFVSRGMQSQEANKRIKILSEKMNELAKKIRNEAKEKKLTEGQMQRKFIEGLEKYTREVMGNE